VWGHFRPVRFPLGTFLGAGAMPGATHHVKQVVANQPESFPATRWSVVIAGAEGTGRREALETLARAYWRPVYGFVRARRRLDEEAALDATQDFFLWLVSSDFLARANPERGRFRAFIKVALDRFLIDAHRASHTEKRGGSVRHVPLDLDQGVPEPADVDGRSPEDVLDDLWRRELIERALTRLGERLEAEGKGKQFKLFFEHSVAANDAPAPGYEELAARHGISRVDVSNWLVRTKARFREEVRRVILETVADATQLGDEMRWLFEDAGPDS